MPRGWLASDEDETEDQIMDIQTQHDQLDLNALEENVSFEKCVLCSKVGSTFVSTFRVNF